MAAQGGLRMDMCISQWEERDANVYNDASRGQPEDCPSIHVHKYIQLALRQLEQKNLLLTSRWVQLYRVFFPFAVEVHTKAVALLLP